MGGWAKYVHCLGAYFPLGRTIKKKEDQRREENRSGGGVEKDREGGRREREREKKEGREGGRRGKSLKVPSITILRNKHSDVMTREGDLLQPGRQSDPLQGSALSARLKAGVVNVFVEVKSSSLCLAFTALSEVSQKSPVP